MFSKLKPPLEMELQYIVSYLTCDKRCPGVQVSGECVQVYTGTPQSADCASADLVRGQECTH